MTLKEKLEQIEDQTSTLTGLEMVALKKRLKELEELHSTGPRAVYLDKNDYDFLIRRIKRLMEALEICSVHTCGDGPLGCSCRAPIAIKALEM